MCGDSWTKTTTFAIFSTILGQKNENPLQGSFIVEELTSLVEEAVLKEFERINNRGGVLGGHDRFRAQARQHCED